MSQESRRREMNAGAIQDFLDANLEQYQPGSIALDEMMFEKKHRGESRVLLREPQLKRLDSEGIANEDESHALLMRLMVEPSSLLARRYPLYHHDLATNIFGSPAGYQRLLQMERSGKQDTRERAANCRAGIEAVLTMLNERGVELVVRPVPSADDRQAAKMERRHKQAKEAYDLEFKQSHNVTKAVRAAADATGYSERRVWMLARDF